VTDREALPGGSGAEVVTAVVTPVVPVWGLVADAEIWTPAGDADAESRAETGGVDIFALGIGAAAGVLGIGACAEGVAVGRGTLPIPAACACPERTTMTQIATAKPIIARSKWRKS
jgi:hypothetical protein